MAKIPWSPRCACALGRSACAPWSRRCLRADGEWSWWWMRCAAEETAQRPNGSNLMDPTDVERIEFWYGNCHPKAIFIIWYGKNHDWIHWIHWLSEMALSVAVAFWAQCTTLQPHDQPPERHMESTKWPTKQEIQTHQGQKTLQSDKYYDEIRDEICDELMGTSSALHGFWVFTLVMSNVSLQFLYQANASSALER